MSITLTSTYSRFTVIFRIFIRH